MHGKKIASNPHGVGAADRQQAPIASKVTVTR